MSKKINTKAINATAETEAEAEAPAINTQAAFVNELVDEDSNELTSATPATTPEAPATELQGMPSLQECFETYPNASLRKLAAATGINYGVLLKKSKEPIPNTIYDPEATNWAALEQKLADKKVDFRALDWNVLNEGPNRKGGTLVKDLNAFKVGDKVYLRRNNATPYEIVYKTETHVVLMLEGTSEPIAWANNTFLINGPVFEPRAERRTAEAAEVEEA